MIPCRNSIHEYVSHTGGYRLMACLQHRRSVTAVAVEAQCRELLRRKGSEAHLEGRGGRSWVGECSISLREDSTSMFREDEREGFGVARSVDPLEFPSPTGELRRICRRNAAQMLETSQGGLPLDNEKDKVAGTPAPLP